MNLSRQLPSACVGSRTNGQGDRVHIYDGVCDGGGLVHKLLAQQAGDRLAISRFVPRVRSGRCREGELRLKACGVSGAEPHTPAFFQRRAGRSEAYGNAYTCVGVPRSTLILILNLLWELHRT